MLKAWVFKTLRQQSKNGFYFILFLKSVGGVLSESETEKRGLGKGGEGIPIDWHNSSTTISDDENENKKNARRAISLLNLQTWQWHCVVFRQRANKLFLSVRQSKMIDLCVVRSWMESRSWQADDNEIYEASPLLFSDEDASFRWKTND